jgi:hypothetical protein
MLLTQRLIATFIVNLKMLTAIIFVLHYFVLYHSLLSSYMRMPKCLVKDAHMSGYCHLHPGNVFFLMNVLLFFGPTDGRT